MNSYFVCAGNIASPAEYDEFARRVCLYLRARVRREKHVVAGDFSFAGMGGIIIYIVFFSIAFE